MAIVTIGEDSTGRQAAIEIIESIARETPRGIIITGNETEVKIFEEYHVSPDGDHWGNYILDNNGEELKSVPSKYHK